ncbi:pilus assembly protein TadG-related protein [Jatrophihabitans sp.]|uniref:pilus assembly protein TadG-related protein n=1 Tax=Jatrophihabitans sp. TaxID=1932789 RepID=UPI002C94664A|nr:pilus assembly protein TadG-related protein [Jatrophihabitans sp.]
MKRKRLLLKRLLAPVSDDRGSTIPLILGFFLIGLLVVAGAVLASDAFTRQRDLQSICDGAAVAGANAIDGPAARTRQLSATLPLAAVQAAVQRYLAEDAGRGEVRIEAALSADGSTVLADCHVHTRPVFAGLIGHPDGLDQHARSQAQGVVQ